MESHIANHAAVADYAQLLAEAAYVLSALAEAPTAGRREEFIVLQSIYAESAVSFQDGSPVSVGLRSMFSSVMALGAVLTPYDDDELPLTAVAGVHIVESITRGLARCLDDGTDLTDVVRGVHALDGRVEQPERVALSEVVGMAERALERFVSRVCGLGS